MRSYLFIASLALIACSAPADNKTDPTTGGGSAGKTSIKGAYVYESVAIDDTVFYAFGIGKELKPDAKDSDGVISRYSITARLLDSNILAPGVKLNAAKGGVVVGNILFCTDIDRVVGIDKRNGSLTFEMKINGAKFLNDIAVKGTDTLYVSDSQTGKIHLIDTRQKTETTLIDKIDGANGLYYDKVSQLLYVVCMGKDSTKSAIYNVPPVPRGTVIASPIGKYSGTLDGLAMLNGQLIISDWKNMDKGGLLLRTNPKTGATKVLSLPETLKGPADFAIASDGLVILPCMLEQRIYFLRLPK